jgi:dihydroorotase
VTSEVTPHHLILDENDLGELDTNRKMYPPLRSPADRLALVKALRRGMIDVVATDHAPHTLSEKDVPFADAPRGVIGLETAASAVWEALGDPDRFFEVLSSMPARLIGLSDHGRPVSPGGPANLVVFDPRAGWTVDTFSSKSANSPFLGREMSGRVRATIHNGEVVHTREMWT